MDQTKNGEANTRLFMTHRHRICNSCTMAKVALRKYAYDIEYGVGSVLERRKALDAHCIADADVEDGSQTCLVCKFVRVHQVQ